MAAHHPAPERTSGCCGGILKNYEKIRVELAVNINNQNDVELIDQVIRSKGVDLVSTDLNEKTFQIEFNQNCEGTCPSLSSLQRSIESQTGFLAIIKGVGRISSAVAEIRPPSNDKQRQVIGVMRLSQLEDGHCYFDGFIQGLGRERQSSDQEKATIYALSVHEYGDLEAPNLDSIGSPMIEIDRRASNTIESLWNISKILPRCDVPNMIGRSVAITNHGATGEQDYKSILAAGVVSRASTVGNNSKKICACSGRTLWEERVQMKGQNESG